MKDWLLYTTAEQFAVDATFREWLASGQFGQPEHRHTQFLRAHPLLYPLAEQAADLLRVTAVHEEALSPQEVQRQIELTWQKIRRSERRRILPLRTRQLWYSAAAMLLLVIGLGWWLNRPTGSITQLATRSSVTVVNRKAETQSLSLADGSVVWLTPGSSLHYPTRFAANRREVSLTGSAFFEIHKDAQQPFFVKTRDLVTRVVGTSFFVKELTEQAGTLVQVRTGKVLVYQNSAPNAVRQRPVLLTANEEVHVRKDQDQLLTEAVKKPIQLSERLNEQRLAFVDTPLTDVLTALSKAYGIPVDYDSDAFRNCLVTTDLADEPLTEKLTILAETIGPGTKAELIGNRIRLSGVGCP